MTATAPLTGAVEGPPRPQPLPPHTTLGDTTLLDVEADIIERILNHKSTTRGGLKGVYQRQERLDLRAQAFSTWGDYVESLVQSRNR